MTHISRLPILTAAATLLLLSTGWAVELRNWTNVKGMVIEAEYLRLEADKVQLKGKDGTLFRPIKLVELSKTDQDYVKEMLAATPPAVGQSLKDPKRMVSPAKEAKIDKKTAFTAVKDRSFEIPDQKFQILESDHFAVLHDAEAADGAWDLIETAERMWLDMNFFHPTFAAKFKDRKFALFLCGTTEVYLKVGKWYADLVAVSGQDPTLEYAKKIDAAYKTTFAAGLKIPGAMAEQFHYLATARAFKSFRENEGRQEKVKGVFDSMRVHSMASLLFDLQAGGASEFAKEGWEAIQSGHGYYREISLTGKSKTSFVSSNGGGVAAGGNTRSTYDSDWGDNLRKAMRKGYKPSLTELWALKAAPTTPESTACCYALSAFLQGTPERVQAYADLVNKIETSHQVPPIEAVAKLYKFGSEKELEAAWIDFIKSPAFK